MSMKQLMIVLNYCIRVDTKYRLYPKHTQRIIRDSCGIKCGSCGINAEVISVHACYINIKQEPLWH